MSLLGSIMDQFLAPLSIYLDLQSNRNDGPCAFILRSGAAILWVLWRSRPKTIVLKYRRLQKLEHEDIYIYVYVYIYIYRCGCRCRYTVDSKKLEYGFRMIYVIFLLPHALGSEDGHIPAFWLLL